jgi:endonuclease I/methionine-rich copper-binding protein CopC
MIKFLHSKLFLSLTLLVTFVFSSAAQVNIEEYYQSASNKTGGELKTALHFIISDHTVLPYTSKADGDDYNVWEALELTDEDPANSNNVILIYTGRSDLKTHKDDGTSDADAWNREHIWAKSHGFGGDPRENPGAATDIHALRPCDKSVNSDRSNLFFDNGGDAHSEATECSSDDDSWEPRDAVKGDIARMILYMAVRYEGEGNNPDLEMTNDMTYSKENYTAPFFGKLSTLLEWNSLDPVDDLELSRNNKVHEIQGNRNPFIDHPEWANTIWVETDSNSPSITEYAPENGTTSVSLTANLTLSFNEKVQEGTGNIVIKRYNDDSEFETLSAVNNPRVTFTNNKVLINPEAKFEEGTKYYVTIDNGVITDASSNSFDGISDKETWNFTATYAPPTIVEFSPEDDSESVSVDTDLEITFDKDVQAGNGQISIYSNGTKVMEMLASVAATFDGEYVTIELSEALNENTEYNVIIDENAFVSANGAAFKGIDSDTYWSFTTELPTGIDDFFAKKSPSFYPNPAKNEIRITNMEDVESMHISNLTGRNIMEIKSPDSRISITNLPKGMYFVTFITKNGNRVTKKLLKR